MFRVPRLFLLALLFGMLVGCTHRENPVQDRSVDANVNGHRLHLLIVGERNGHPAVILESGLGGGIAWNNNRNQLARFAQVITYDRAGTGGSEPGPEPRDARTIAGELHASLHEAGVAPPYVLVGQSLGGIYVQVFAAMFPEETAGLVMVDPTYASADVCLSTDEVKAWFMSHQPDDWPRVEAACRGAPDGLAGFLASKYKLMEAFIETVPEPRRSALRTEWWTMVDKLIGGDLPWKMEGGKLSEARVLIDSIRQAMAARPLPKVPTILLAAGRTDLDALPASSPNVRALQAEARRWRMANYRNWVDQTPGAKLVVVKDSGHDIEGARPQAVIDAVREALR